MGKEMYRKIFLEELPKKEGRGSLKGKEVIDWKSSIGYSVEFVYDDIRGEVEIVDYEVKGQVLTIKYLDNLFFKIKTGNFQSCGLGKLLKKKTNIFKYDIGQTLKDNKRDLTIVDREYREFIHKPNKKGIVCIQKEKYYKYTCNKCGYNEHWIIESNLNKGIGCACCSNKKAILGANTIWDTDRWMVGLGVSEEDAKKYTKSSGKKIEVICPYCKRKKKAQIRDIFRHKSIGCICGDGFSYPEKFISNILNQLKIDFITQLSYKNFEWCNDKKYDFYLPEYNTIIEAHGEQHYTKSFFNAGGKTLEEEQENDRVKKELALANGINKYIVIDCRRSEMEWIRGSILNSELAKLFSLSKIDWIKCEKFALPNLVKEVCEYWNNKEEWETTVTIAKNNPWGIKVESTILKYIKKELI